MTNHGVYHGVASDSPWKVPDSPKSQRAQNKRKIPFDNSFTKPYSKQHPVKYAKTQHVESKVAHEYQLPELEKKYKAVLKLSNENHSNGMTNDRCEEIAGEFGVGTGRNLRLLAKKASTGESLLRKPGQGAKKTVCNDEKVIDFFKRRAATWEFEFSKEAMAEAMQDELGVGSTTTVTNLMDQLDYKKAKLTIKPSLTDGHAEDRLNWCRERETVDFFSEDCVRVHIDEKWFFCFRSGRTVYVPADAEPPHVFALSKTQIPKAMFFGAVAPPNKARDGKIGCWLVCDQKIAL
jgi:transposase